MGKYAINDCITADNYDFYLKTCEKVQVPKYLIQR